MIASSLRLTLLLGLWLALVLPTGAAEHPDFISLVEQNRDTVVSINGRTTSIGSALPDDLPIPEDSPFYDYFRRFFEEQQRPGPRRRQAATGSGFILSADGYIMTNAHVVDGSDDIVVTLSNRTEYPAEVIGTDNRTDIALLRIEAENLPAVTIGDPGRLRVGQWVLAIGSPFGFNYTATQGIISGLGRSLPSGNYVPYIQTDAAVNPGNSGGPLFNLDGEVIGINSQIYSRTGGYQGLSFAIPIDVAIDVADQLRDTGAVDRGWLGVLIQEVTAELAESFDLDRPRGALVSQVVPDSPAAKAGFEVGDVILAFNGEEVETSSALPPMVGLVRPGRSAEVTIFRNGREQVVEITIERLPDDPRMLAGPAEEPVPEPTANRLGITVATPDPEQSETGVLVQEVRSGAAAEAGIEPGDIIIRLNNQPVENVEGFEELVAELPSGRPVPVLIRRGEGSLFLAMTLTEEDG
jgi:serine protease Do